MSSIPLLRPRWKRVTLSLAAVILVSLVGVTCSQWGTSASAKRACQEKAETLLSDAHSQSDHALDLRIKSVRAVFARGRAGADAFAAEALSWRGKWALIEDTLGIGEENAHAAFLAELFARHIFSNADLKNVLDRAVAGYVSDTDAIENSLLVQLRADLADSELGRGGKMPALASDAAFQEEYRQLATGLIRTMQIDGGMEIGRQVANFVAVDVATPVVVRIVEFVAAELGMEAGILSAGAASSFTTLGIGFIVGYIADEVIVWVLKQAGYDPAAEIAGKIRASLDRVESLLIDGTATGGGLRRELLRIGSARARCQDAVIHKLLEEGGE